MLPENRRPKLAVTDDDADFRYLVRRVAMPLGWDVDEYPNGTILTARLEHGGAPDMLFLNMIMPGLDGMATLAKVARIGIRCPIVLVTGKLRIYASTGSTFARVNGLDVRAAIQKPVPLKQLRELLNLGTIRTSA